MAPRPKILFLDAYDSFSNNITALLATLLDVDVFVLPIDTPLLDPGAPGFGGRLRRELARYEAVICGPGPGSPGNEKDVGLMSYIWQGGADGDGDVPLLPALGICLGFQSLVTAHGGVVRRLRRGLHGMVREIVHQGCGGGGRGEEQGVVRGDIFEGVGNFKATLYHSLCMDIGQDAIPDAQWESEKWRPSSAGRPDLVPLAWVEEQGQGGDVERILMAVRHATKPFWGLQYHPESVCTDEEGHRVLKNWFREAVRWNRQTKRAISPDDGILARNAARSSLLSLSVKLDRAHGAERQGQFWRSYGLGFEFHHRTIELPPTVQVPDIAEVLAAKGAEHIILDSANASVLSTGLTAATNNRGKFSIIALDVEMAPRLEYRTGKSFATARLPYVQGVPVDLTEQIPLDGRQSIWQLLAEFHEARRLVPSDGLQSPFLGGFMGYITYEQGLSDIGIELPGVRAHTRPDICLAWVTKTIVIDHERGLVHIQQLQSPQEPAEEFWLESVTSRLQSSHPWRHTDCGNLGNQKVRRQSTSQFATRKEALAKTLVRAPVPLEYEEKVKTCQDYIAAGESYELCLTDQTDIILPLRGTGTEAPRSSQASPKMKRRSSKVPSSWQFYRQLRTRQPAPFASYIRLGAATLISSSPERFLQYDRGGLCSMKPMKGTVRKSDAVQTLAQAEAILHVPKEEAENLMIVDLVRHDLHGICGPANVSVPHLMKVEEYQSVFQMITVVEGQLPETVGSHQEETGMGMRYTGLDVLAASLPPGSMTGAPKKRSCEILQQIEKGRERSMYSGVVGYMCVSGAGDWSVTIRSLFRWDDENLQPTNGAGDGDDGGEAHEVWHVGAGGAVTVLSTPEGEREEMFTKLAGPLSIFE